MATDLDKATGDNTIEPKSQTLQFSKAPIMDNFGELQPGEIPEPLKYSRPFSKPTNTRTDHAQQWY